MGAELPTTKPTIAGMHWCDGGSHETRTEPSEPLKDAGYATANPGTIPTAANWNWLLYIIGEILAWFDRAIIRRFSSPVDAIDAVEDDSIVCIQTPYSATARGIWSEIQTIVTGKTITGFCGDGKYLFLTYVAAGDVQAYECWNADLGTRAWELVTDGAGGNHAICTDGAYLYTVYQDHVSGARSIKIYAVDDHTLIGTVAMHTTPGEIRKIACNGKQVVITTLTSAHEVEIFEWVDGTLTYVDEVNVGASDDLITALYCGPDYFAVGFEPDSATFLARCYDLAGNLKTSILTTDFDTAPTSITGITADAHGMLLSCDTAKLGSADTTTVCLRWCPPFAHSAAWVHTAAGVSLEGGPIVTDGNVAIVLGAASVSWYDCHTMTPIGWIVGVLGTQIACDGYRVHVVNGTNIYQFYLGYDARLMRVCNTSDVNRIPLQGSRIVPLDGNRWRGEYIAPP